MINMTFIMTDYSIVYLSEKTLKWLNTLSPDWESVINDKRKTSKKALFIKAKYNDLITAVNIASTIAFINAEDMKEY